MEYMFLPLKRYAEFSGRSRRTEFWMFALFQFLVWIVFLTLCGIVAGSMLMSMGKGDAGGLMAAGGTVMILLLIGVLIALAFFLPGLAVGMRRLHDTNRSGWWLGGYLILALVGGFLRAQGGAGLAGLISIVQLGYLIALIVFYCLDGTKGPNKYGPDPKGQADAQVFA
ncbi:MAG TPA: DUF805 domain-containing protein [Allosphingosinicella sp.]